jgi:hypothetical protein
MFAVLAPLSACFDDFNKSNPYPKLSTRRRVRPVEQLQPAGTGQLNPRTFSLARLATEGHKN